MSRDFQSISIIGSVGKDPESRSTPNGVKVVTFSVAVESGFGEGAYTEWFNCTCFRDRADFAEKYLKKGKKVAITGKLKTRSWDDKETGQKKYRTELIVDLLDFFGGEGKSEGATRSSASVTRQQTTPAPRAAPVSDDPFGDDELPF